MLLYTFKKLNQTIYMGVASIEAKEAVPCFLHDRSQRSITNGCEVTQLVVRSSYPIEHPCNPMIMIVSDTPLSNIKP